MIAVCFHCPASLAIEDEKVTIRLVRIAETTASPRDVSQDPEMLAGFEAGERFLMALQATLYIQNRPAVTEVLHGIVESDIPGESACAFENEWAVASLLVEVQRSASATGHLRDGHWVLH